MSYLLTKHTKAVKISPKSAQDTYSMFLKKFRVYDMLITWSSGNVTLENEAKSYIS